MLCRRPSLTTSCCAGDTAPCQWACTAGSCHCRSRHAPSNSSATSLTASCQHSLVHAQASGVPQLRQPFDFSPKASLHQRPLLASSMHEPGRLVPCAELPPWAAQALAAAVPAWTAVRDSPAQMRGSPLDPAVLKVLPGCDRHPGMVLYARHRVLAFHLNGHISGSPLDPAVLETLQALHGARAGPVALLRELVTRRLSWLPSPFE